jgi:hypothetical protein
MFRFRVQIYSTTDSTWTPGGTAPGKIYNSQCIALTGSPTKILVFINVDKPTTTYPAALYNTVDKTWELLTSATAGSLGGACAVRLTGDQKIHT